MSQYSQSHTTFSRLAPLDATAIIPMRGLQVTRQHGQIAVGPRSDGWSPLLLGPGEVLVQVVAAGICGADIRVGTGNKLTHSDGSRPVTMGHEGVGFVVATAPDVSGLRQGDYVVVLPHRFSVNHATYCPATTVNPACIGKGHTDHLGWDLNGTFADYFVSPASHLVPVSPQQLAQAAALAPDLPPGAIFAVTEPMLCVLSAYDLLERQLDSLLRRRMRRSGRALVMGCGPIGLLHAVVLAGRGYEVTLADPLAERAELTRWCLGRESSLFDDARHRDFDLVMVAASSARAISQGEELVRDGGVLYLFAGLNTAEHEAHGPSELFTYERLHRAAHPVLTTTRERKAVLYLGHSGYFDTLASQAVSTVAANADALARAITGVIRGWASASIESRLPGGVAWHTQDGAPALLRVLGGHDFRSDHCKLLVLAQPPA